MEVRDLAPALLALGQAFDRANSLLNGDRASIGLSIRATRPGSFEVELFLQQVLEGAGDVLTGDLFTSAANLTEMVVGGPIIGMGLFTLLKRLRGRKPNISTQQPDGVVFEAENIRLLVPTEVVRLYSDKPIRDQLEAFVRPLVSRVPGSGVRGRGSGERETTASSLAGKHEAREKEDNGGQGKDGPAGAIAQGGNGR